MPDPKAMKKIGALMNLFMGVTLSLCLSLAGNLMGGHFTVPGFLISFGISFMISLLIGFLIPHRQAGEAAVRKIGARPGSIKARLMESLISDCIYTPIITLIMVGYAYFTSRAHASPEALEHMPGYFQMFIGSFAVCMVVGYILIFIFMPLYLKLCCKIAGVPFPPGAGGPPTGVGKPPER